jgi:hypothetical protein
VAGQLGPSAPAKPESQAKIDAALATLRPAHGPFVVRLYIGNGMAGAAARSAVIAHARAELRHYAALGYGVEFAVRYQPSGSAPDVPAFVALVRAAVDELGTDPATVSLQVANEVNFTAAPDAADGAYAGARDALIAGVIAAHDEAVRRHATGHLAIGFNWFYRTTPQAEDDFWSYLHDHGGARFASSVDYVALDAYPGTFFPPSNPPDPGDSLVNALSVLKKCFMPEGGLPKTLPLRVHENGYPTGAGRSEDSQRSALDRMVRTVDAYRSKYGITDYRWFDLRDGDSSSPNFQQQFGITHDDYSPKPAFFAYRDLVHSLSPPPAAIPPPPTTCVDTAPPVSRLDRHHSRATRRGVTLSGTASDRGCGGALREVRVFVSLPVSRGRCRFLTAASRLAPAGDCRRPRLLAVRGTTRWRFSASARLPAGRYELGVRAVDRAGHAERARGYENRWWLRVR